MADDFDLQRFVTAQDPQYLTVLEELRAGEKQSHWMWYVFPQFEGLGSSWTARRYAIRSLAEARAYLEHSILGPRLLECVDLVLALQGQPIEFIFPHPDYLKFHSCMTLFEIAAGDPQPFRAAIEKYFQGAREQATVRIAS